MEDTESQFSEVAWAILCSASLGVSSKIADSSPIQRDFMAGPAYEPITAEVLSQRY